MHPCREEGAEVKHWSPIAILKNEDIRESNPLIEVFADDQYIPMLEQMQRFVFEPLGMVLIAVKKEDVL